MTATVETRTRLHRANGIAVVPGVLSLDSAKGQTTGPFRDTRMSQIISVYEDLIKIDSNSVCDQDGEICRTGMSVWNSLIFHQPPATRFHWKSDFGLHEISVPSGDGRTPLAFQAGVVQSRATAFPLSLAPAGHSATISANSKLLSQRAFL